MGRTPKPTRLHELAGMPGKRNLGRDNEPPEIPGMPEPPARMQGEALAEWHRLCGELDQMGVLSKTYRSSIEVYCDTYGLYLQALASLAKHGPFYKHHDGTIRRNPARIDVNQAVPTLIRYQQEFGLTPASKTRIAMEQKSEEKDAFTVLMESRRASAVYSNSCTARATGESEKLEPVEASP